MGDFRSALHDFTGPYVGLLVTVGITLAAHYVLFGVLALVSRRAGSFAGKSLVRRSREPVLVAVLLLIAQIYLPLLGLPENLGGVLARVASILLICAVAWLLVRLTLVGQDVIRRHYDVHTADNLRARRVQTQFTVLRRLAVSAIVLLAVASILMTFEPIRQLGAGLLASAGIAGIIVGFAAQKTLGTFIAGLQIAITQPVRIDDVVVLEGEFGTVEEITLTYAVVKLWDQRRLVLPTTYFLERPFQNWTRTGSEMLGTVYLSVDHTVPVAAVRDELARILQDEPLWDRRVQGLQVTDVTETTIQLRALLSAADAGKAWDLRCAVREKLITFVRERYPQSLPRVRAEIADLRAAPAPGERRRGEARA